MSISLQVLKSWGDISFYLLRTKIKIKATYFYAFFIELSALVPLMQIWLQNKV